MSAKFEIRFEGNYFFESFYSFSLNIKTFKLCMKYTL